MEGVFMVFGAKHLPSVLELLVHFLVHDGAVSYQSPLKRQNCLQVYK